MFLGYETQMKKERDSQKYTIVIYLNADWHATLIETQAVAQTIKQIQGRLELTLPVVKLLELQESGAEDPMIPKYLRVLNAKVNMYVCKKS